MLDVGKAVSDAWSFLVGPVIVSAILLAVIWFLAGSRLRDAASRLRAARSIPLQNSVAHKFMKAYGITKILPLAALISLAFILHASNVSLKVLGDLLPGEIVSLPNQLLLHVDHGTLEDIWAAHPQMKSPNEVAEYAQSLIAIAKEQKPGVFAKNSEYWGKELGRRAVKFNLVKAFLAIATFLTAIQMRSRGVRRLVLKRFLVVLCVGIIVGTWYFFGQLYALEQGAYADDRVLRTAVELDLEQRTKNDTVDPDRHDELRFAQDRAHHAWWKVKFGEAQFLSWILRTVHGKGA